MIVLGAAPPMVDALRRVRRCMSRRVFCRFCHPRSRVSIVFGPFHYCAFCERAAPDAPETIDDQRRCTGCRYRTICSGSRGSASLPWDFARTRSCAIRHRTSEEGEHLVRLMEKSLSSDSARARSQKQQREASRQTAPDARERIPAPAKWLGPIASTVHTNDSTLSSSSNSPDGYGVRRPIDTRPASKTLFDFITIILLPTSMSYT